MKSSYNLHKLDDKVGMRKVIETLIPSELCNYCFIAGGYFSEYIEDVDINLHMKNTYAMCIANKDVDIFVVNLAVPLFNSTVFLFQL